MSDFDATTEGEIETPPSSDQQPGAAPTTPTSGPPPLADRGRPSFVWLVVSLSMVLILVVGFIVINNVHTNDYALAPGDAQPVTPYIKVPSVDTATIHGQILLTDVYLEGPLTVWDYITDSFNSDDSVQSAADLLGGTPEPQYLTQGFLDMAQSQSDATAAALTHLGYDVQGKNAGVMVYGITPGVPAASELSVGQIITKVNGTATPDECSLLVALRGLQPGSSAMLSVEHSSVNDNGDFVSGPVLTKAVTLQRPPADEPEITGCGPAFHPTAIVGFQPDAEQWVNWTFPVKVNVHIADIGGPSAGLAMTLGIIDKLSGGHLTGNRIIAATGTIEDPRGDVGDVGGVAQKTVAVERAGATVFFVPEQELAAARSKATSRLHVYAVSTLDQALSILKRLGGTVPAKHVTAEAAS